MGVSKVVYGDDTLVDLTGDTVTPTSLTLGATAHGADGEPIVGEYQYVLPPMSDTTRGGARIQPDSGLEITDTDNLQVRLALQSDGTVRGGIAELTAKGHAEQVSTTGKNLLDAQTFFTDIAPSYKTKNLQLAPNTTYVMSTTLPKNNDGGANLFAFDTGASGSTNTNGVWEGQSRTVTTGADGIVVVGYRYGGYTDTSLAWYLSHEFQLELGSTATEYEPYTGGAPSPSPDYPQEIRVVRGRNLWDPSKAVNNNDWMMIGCTLGSNTPDGTLILDAGSYAVTTGANSSLLAVRGADGRAVFYQQNVSVGTFTIDSRQAVLVAVSKSSSQSWSDFQFQLNAGPTPQPYVPYGHVGMEVQGKNLLPNNATSQTINGVTFTVNADGSVTVNGTASATTIFNLSSNNEARIEPNTEYVLSGCPSGCTYNTYYLRVTDNSTKAIDDFGASSTFSYANTKAIQFSIRIISGTTVNNVVFKPQVELGSEATEYEPYYHTTTPIPLPSRGWVAGLPDGTADSLQLDGAGKCEWTLPTKMIAPTSALTPSTSIHSVIADDARQSPNNTSYIASVYCTHLAATFANDTWSKNIGCSINANGSLCIYAGDFSSTDEVNEWIASSGIKILYPLATPVTEDCGYCEDWPTDIPEGAMLSIRELDSVGIKYFIDSAVTELAKQWYARAEATIGQAVVELAYRVSQLENA